ncbi:transcriptional regulator [Xenorhabdus ehlersii]|uniref:ParB/Sulfiredoxin domain-containing protein n=1 Tax=Xenorhabdus ehlersii TaxID=290111 RepID=A0A2D0IKA4_9GAMM|nr:transcriptional regulator [Xenorhabdus ehlersii]PHM22207.1 hypothetical protein Xehl_03853 [Xenorhabdus ehlersii]RKE93045.1 hypothetical protein BDE27_0738 [Xenorhabdus ehlersii]
MKSKTISEKSYHIDFELVENLIQSEEVNIFMVEKLLENIKSEGAWKSVLPIEYESRWIMDGNHRLNVAYRLGLLFIPVVRLKYNDHRVKVYNWENDKLYCIDNLSREIESKKILPYKTTRHLFEPLLPDVNFNLNTLCDKKVWLDISGSSIPI